MPQDQKRINFVFDVDGTLTPSRQPIDPEFASWWKNWCVDKWVYLVTGSDIQKTKEQLGMDFQQHIFMSFQCCGNSVWKGGSEIYKNDWKLSDEQYEILETALYKSSFGTRTGEHIEERPGMVNFSIVGRKATLHQRSAYVKFDIENNERKRLRATLAKKFPELEVHIGGETGLDIFPKGFSKEQVKQKIYGRIVFFGDAIYRGGNDYPFAKTLSKEDIVYKVKNWEETWEILKTKWT